MLHEKSHAMLFRCNGIVRGELNNGDIPQAQFIPTRCPGVLPNNACHDEGGFLSDLVTASPNPLTDLRTESDTLDDPCAIPYQ